MNKNDPQSSKDLSKGSQDKNKQSDKGLSGGNFKKGDDIFAYAKSNKEQAIAYVLLALGLLCLIFFHGLLGGLIIGMVAGYCFASEIIYYIRNIGQVIGGQNQLRYVVLTAVILGLFIEAPGIFIGALIVAAFKNAMCGPCDTSNPK